MIVETSANKFYRVVEISQAGLEHCWFGIPVKWQVAPQEYVMTRAGMKLYANGRPELVRKAGCRVVEG